MSKEVAELIANRLKEHTNNPHGYTIADQWEETCSKYRSKTCFINISVNPPQRLTFGDVDLAANRVAHWALKQGLSKGDVVALFMENRPEFVISWIGFCKIGVKTAWVNNTIKGKPLVHSIKVSGAKMLLFGHELADIVGSTFDDLVVNNIVCFCTGGFVSFCPSIDAALAKQPTTCNELKQKRKGINFWDVMCFIYTSGTTGLPKAAKILHARWWRVGMGALPIGITSNDVCYGAGMPLYHSAAGMIGIGYVVCVGVTYIIRRKFSASNWIADVRSYNATCGQYIGELARYVMATPKKPTDGNNQLRLLIGNGMRPEYWEQFQMRFNIDLIVEFYGATEGTGAFINAISLENLKKGDKTGYGAVGNINTSPPGKFRFLKYDVDKEELVCGTDGFCKDAAVNEPGELVVIVTEDKGSKFVGYNNKSATKKKQLSNVFEHGDLYTRTGDLLKYDEQGWVYFVDRMGDTFRWKGENVSTTEVATEIAKCEGVEEVNVYGVQIPNNLDGRCGMAALVIDPTPAMLKQLANHCKKNLPPYAIPVFLRILPRITVTATFKHQKVKLRKEGINPALCSDSLFYLQGSRYLPFSMNEYKQITSSTERARL